MFKLFRRSKRSDKANYQADHGISLSNVINNAHQANKASRSVQLDVSAAAQSSNSDYQMLVESQQRWRGHRMSRMETFGLDQAFNQASDLLGNEGVGGLGIYGMGGAGKTTLMRKIHQDFLLAHGFQIIWITVSKTVNVDKVQHALMKKMGLNFDPDEEPYNRAQMISRKLLVEDKKVALLLDDIWEVVDLEVVLGLVEFDPSIFKIVFTTRSEKVCSQMKPHAEIKMECLGWDDSWALFKKSVGREALCDSDCRIVEIAKDIANECKGLPLALVVIGRAVTGLCSVEEWKSALSTLRKSPAEYAEKDLFSRLKFSYDTLPTQIAKDCFLHCCSFPEGSYITNEELIEFWMGEGVLGLHASYEEASNKGYEIIRTLQAACLLEKQNRSEVTIHDVIREMGLWITSDVKLNFLHDAELDLSNEEIAERWRTARRIFISETSRLPKLPVCNHLLALLQSEPSGRRLVRVPINFFRSLNGIRVLHLDGVKFHDIPVAIGTLMELRYLYISRSNLTRLPEEIGLLRKLIVLRLQDNNRLRECPPTIGQMVELRKLVFNTGPKELPIGFTDLKKLEVLKLGDTTNLGCLIERFLFSFAKMDGLRILNLHVTSINILPPDLWDLTMLENLAILCRENHSNPSDLVGGLGRLCGLRTLRMSSWPFNSEDELLSALKNMNKLAELYIDKLPIDALPILAKPNLPCLSKLVITGCFRLEVIRIGETVLPNLNTVVISGCYSLRHIFGLHHLKCLTELRLHDCTSVEELVSEGEKFPKLKILELCYMRDLRKICNDSHMLPFITEFRLSYCPELKRLPRGLMNESRSLKTCVIKGEQKWWDGLLWQDDDFKSFLLLYFTPSKFFGQEWFHYVLSCLNGDFD